MLVIEGFFDDMDPENVQKWYDGAEMLRNINPHVMEDYQDFLLLHGFQNQKDIKGNRDITKRIDEVLKSQRILAKIDIDKNKDKYGDDLPNDPIEEGKIFDKKRNFKNPLRPHSKVWNFEEEKDPVPHVLRPEADPMVSYEDGRVQKLQDLVIQLGVQLKTHQAERWK